MSAELSTVPVTEPQAASTVSQAAMLSVMRRQRLQDFIFHKVTMLFALSVLGMGLVKKQFFPVSDRPEVLVEVQMPYGTSIEQTSRATEKVETWLRRQGEAKIVTA